MTRRELLSLIQKKIGLTAFTDALDSFSDDRHFKRAAKNTQAGAGGFGQVWRATDAKLGREVAEGLEIEPDRLVVEHFSRNAACVARDAATPCIRGQRRRIPSGSSEEQQLQEHFAQPSR